MRMDRLTLRAQDILNSAQNIATEHDSYEIQPEHILKALVEQDGGIFTSIAQKLGAPLSQIRSELKAYIDSMPRQTGAGPGGAALSPISRDVLNAAWNHAVKLGDQYMSTEHIILALADSDSPRAKHILNANGFNKESILRVLMDIRGSKKAMDENAEDKYREHNVTLILFYYVLL